MQVMSFLAELRAQHPGIRASGKSLVVHLVGHSLGGFLAEAVCVGVQDLVSLGWKVRCTTFESTGLPPSYVDKALQRHREHYWTNTMCTYLAAPNPINMLCMHLGRIVHVKIPIDNSVQRMGRAVKAEAARATGAALLGVLLWPAARRMGVGRLAAATGRVAAAVMRPFWGVGRPLALIARPVVAAGRGLWGLASSQRAFTGPWWAAFGLLYCGCQIVAIEMKELKDLHNAESMLRCFDSYKGDVYPRYRMDMGSWPKVGDSFGGELLGLLPKLGSALLPSFFNHSSFGIRNIFDVGSVIAGRSHRLEGFQLMTDDEVEELQQNMALRAAADKAAAAKQAAVTKRGARVSQAMAAFSRPGAAPAAAAPTARSAMAMAQEVATMGAEQADKVLDAAWKAQGTRAAAGRWRKAASKPDGGASPRAASSRSESPSGSSARAQLPHEAGSQEDSAAAGEAVAVMGRAAVMAGEAEEARAS
jgi:hypothetical protein